ncbi:hypothetical protein [Candidatus Doolittlea endobia]|nr:hypothetical protein [Candidatus Doolittlea endobia]
MLFWVLHSHDEKTIKAMQHFADTNPNNFWALFLMERVRVLP